MKLAKQDMTCQANTIPTPNKNKTPNSKLSQGIKQTTKPNTVLFLSQVNLEQPGKIDKYRHDKILHQTIFLTDLCSLDDDDDEYYDDYDDDVKISHIQNPINTDSV